MYVPRITIKTQKHDHICLKKSNKSSKVHQLFLINIQPFLCLYNLFLASCLHLFDLLAKLLNGLAIHISTMFESRCLSALTYEGFFMLLNFLLDCSLLPECLLRLPCRLLLLPPLLQFMLLPPDLLLLHSFDVTVESMHILCMPYRTKNLTTFPPYSTITIWPPISRKTARPWNQKSISPPPYTQGNHQEYYNPISIYLVDSRNRDSHHLNKQIHQWTHLPITSLSQIGGVSKCIPTDIAKPPTITTRNIGILIQYSPTFTTRELIFCNYYVYIRKKKKKLFTM